MDKEYYNSNQIDLLIDRLADKIIASGVKFTAIVGIARGGVPVMERLNKRLNLPSYIIRISFYKDTDKQKEPLVEMNSFVPDKRGVYLVVDDLIDSGTTFDWISENLDMQYKSAVIFWNPKSSVSWPDFYAENHKGKWIVFPWEVKHELKTCQSCEKTFECKSGDVIKCQCSEVILTDNEASFIKDKFNECLCIGCIKKLQSQYKNESLKQRLELFLVNSNLDDKQKNELKQIINEH